MSKRSKKRREDVMRIRKTFESSKRRYGAPKIKKKLEYRGIMIGLNRGKQINEGRRNEKYNIEEIQSLE